MFSDEIYVDLKNAGIFVIDIQNDFCSPQGILAERGFDVSFAVPLVNNLKEVLSLAREKEIPIIYHLLLTDKSKLSKEQLKNLANQKLTNKRGTPLLCRPGYFGSEIYSLEPDHNDGIFERYAPDLSVFSNPALVPYLRERGIDTLLFTGCETHACVLESVKAAKNLDYSILVASDLTDSLNTTLHNSALRNMEEEGLAKIVTSRDIIKNLLRGTEYYNNI